MIGPNGDSVEYNYNEPLKLIPKCDGVRILSNLSMEFLHHVSDFTTSFVGIGSIFPATLLYDVRDHYDIQSKGSVRYGMTELTQWLLNAFSLGNSGMAVQS
jgi:vacuolar protein sorting-associated protein 16